MAKTQRLGKTKDIEAVMKSGKAFFTKDLTIKFLGNNLRVNRLAVIVSNAVHKNSTVRNRLRRIIKDQFQKERRVFFQPLDLLIIVSKNTSKYPTTPERDLKVRESLSYALKKIR